MLVISHELWRSRFGGDPTVVSRPVVLGGMPATVIGVMPAGFEFPGPVDFWVPLTLYTPERMARHRRVHNLGVVARLRDGASLSAAQSELDMMAARAAREHPGEDPGHRPRVVGLREALVRDLRPALAMLMGAVGLVQLIACSNVANLLLARVPARRRELAIRAALGAGQARLFRQVLVEGLLLSTIGAALAIAVASWGMDALAVPDPRLRDLPFDGRVLGFATGVTLITALLFGSLPAWATHRVDVAEALKAEAPRATGGSGARALRGLLVVSECRWR